MKKIPLSLVAAVFLWLGCGAVAYSQSDQDQLRLRHEWGLGPEVSHITYKEPGIMKEKGMMNGVTGFYSCRPSPDIYLDQREIWMIKAEGRLSYGQLDYNGSGTINDIDDLLFEIRGLGGLDLAVSDAFDLTPYLGIGYRYLNDDSSGRISSTGAYGYMRESNYIYSPVGIEAARDFQKGWSFGLTAEYDIFLWGQQNSYLSDAVVGLNDVENRQLEGYGVRGSIKLMKENDDINFIFEPFIRYWDIETSEIGLLTYYGTIIGYAWEPANNSTEIGCKFTVEF